MTAHAETSEHAWKTNPTAEEFERGAAGLIPTDAHDFITGGAGDETSVRGNRAAFKRRVLVPRIATGEATPSVSLRVAGTELSAPIFVAPMGGQKLIHPKGEAETVTAAARAGVGYISSTASSITLEQEAELAGDAHWFQLYCVGSRDVTRSLIERAERTNVQAICVTADVPEIGLRLRDRRNAFHPVHRMAWANVADVDHSLLRVTWSLLEWIRAQTTLPLLVKGILDADDAVRCLDIGIDGFIVSNPGGRQLQGAPATLDALPAVAGVAPAGTPVLVDGGVRDAEDIVIALAQGATAVVIGRPILWALACGGADGVVAYLDDLRAGLVRTLALLGLSGLEDARELKVQLR